MDLENNFFTKPILYNGVPVTFEIIPMEGTYGVALDGNVIAEVAYWEDWEQTSGEALQEPVLEAIFDAIDEKYI